MGFRFTFKSWDWKNAMSDGCFGYAFRCVPNAAHCSVAGPRLKKQKPPLRWRSHIIFCRPYGARAYLSAYTALTRWATLFRAYGARWRAMASTVAIPAASQLER